MQMRNITFLSAGRTDSSSTGWAILAVNEDYPGEQFLIPTDEGTCRFLNQNGVPS